MRRKKKAIIIFSTCLVLICVSSGFYQFMKKNTQTSENKKYELNNTDINKLNSLFRMTFGMRPVEITSSKDGSNILNLFTIDLLNQLDTTISLITNNEQKKEFNLEFFNQISGLASRSYGYGNTCEISKYIKNPNVKQSALRFEEISRTINQILEPYSQSGLGDASVTTKEKIKNELIEEKKKLLEVYSKMEKGNPRKAKEWENEDLKYINDMNKTYQV